MRSFFFVFSFVVIAGNVCAQNLPLLSELPEGDPSKPLLQEQLLTPLPLASLSARNNPVLVLDSIVVHNLDTSTFAFYPSYKVNYSYSPSGDCIFYELFHWVGDLSTWEKSYLEEYSYTPTGKIKQTDFFLWNADSSVYTIVQKKVYTYNADEQLKDYVYSSWNEDDLNWNPTQKDTFRYDNEGFLVEDVHLNFGGSSNWTLATKTEYEYDSNGNLAFSYFYTWNFIGSNWITEKLTEYSYDSYGHELEAVTSEWEFQPPYYLWAPKIKYENEYDAEGNRVARARYHWNDDIDEWEPVWRREYVFNNDYGPSDLWFSFFLEKQVPFTHRLDTVYFYSWDEESSDWLYDSDWVCYYSEHDTETGIDEIHIFPNPVYSEFTFIWEQAPFSSAVLQIFDVKGALVLSREIESSTTVDVSSFPRGVYFCVLQSKEGSEWQAGRFMKY